MGGGEIRNSVCAGIAYVYFCTIGKKSLCYRATYTGSGTGYKDRAISHRSMEKNARIRVLLPIMSAENTDVLRLRKKHLPKNKREPTPEEGQRLIDAQSMLNAILASVITIIAFGIVWSMLSTLIGSIYPWMTMVMGVFIGLAVRRAGYGLDWRFPVIAAVFAIVGSLAGNVIVAAAFTAPELGTDTLTVLRSLTALTWPVFFDEVMTPADIVFALFAAGIAAFFANRRLTRDQYLALRTLEEHRDQQD